MPRGVKAVSATKSKQKATKKTRKKTAADVITKKKARRKKTNKPKISSSLSHKTLVDDLKHVRDFAITLRHKAKFYLPPTLPELGIFDAKEVIQKSPSKMLDEIDCLISSLLSTVLGGGSLHLRIPSRSASNQVYVKELHRIVLKSKFLVRNFDSVAGCRKMAIMIRVLELMYQVLTKGIHITKRDLFYTDVKLFKKQEESDGVLDDIACVLGSTRTYKGVVVGRISFKEAGDVIDCTKMGVSGKAVPAYIDRLTDLKSDAEFVLLIEKDAAYMRLAEDRFYNKYPCILITAKGQPDVATRLFLRKIHDELHLPILGLFDADPYGLKILSVYGAGSRSMSYDSASLATPGIKWLGQCRLPMTDADIKAGKDMLEDPLISSNPAWHKELKLMVKSKMKAEIQALSAFGFQYLTEEYLPRKIREGDWI
eukprot:GSMAST32.ASY1.ANO1.129.1 assembled CDS